MNTLFLSLVMGWYLVIVSLLILCRYEEIRPAIKDITNQPGLFFVLALLTVIIGLLLVVSHNVWVWGCPVVITILAWLVLLSGLLRLVCPTTATRISNAFLNYPTRVKVVAVILLLIGVFLLFNVYYPYL